MYKSFFRFKSKPFELLPDPEFLYMSPAHRKAMSYLDYGIKERAGFILLTGEVGSGKTTIIKNIIKSLDTKITTSLVFTTNVTAHQLLSLINEDFGLEVAGKDKITLIRELNDFLIRQFVDGRRTLLLVDEAQNLSLECLEEVRMLSNLETESTKLLQIILVGQPELRKILASSQLRQLRQRISINCHIPPLDRPECEAYILHRLECAGNRSALIFTSECFDIIQRHTRGIPRLINIMSDFLLLTAYVDEVNILTSQAVREVAADLQFDRHYWNAADAAEGPSPDSRKWDAYESDLLQLTKAVTERLDALEKGVVATVHPDELTSLLRRHELLEESVRKLCRQVDAGAQRSLAAPAAASSGKNPLPPVTASPSALPGKGFFQSLFGRS